MALTNRILARAANGFRAYFSAWMTFVVTGMLNKQVASKIGASEATLKNPAGPSHAEDAGWIGS
jgi:hypothetical protein